MDKDKVIIFVLYYFKKKILLDVIIKKLKFVLKIFCIFCMKDFVKEIFLSFFGRVFFERKIVVRKDCRDVIIY